MPVYNKGPGRDTIGEAATATSWSGRDEGEAPEVAAINGIGDGGTSHEAVLSAVALDTDMVSLSISSLSDVHGQLTSRIVNISW